MTDMRRTRLAAAAAIVALFAGLTASVSASAATANDTACRKATISGSVSHEEIVAYDACRFDKLDAAVAALKPTSTPVPAPTPSSTPTSTPSSTPTSTTAPAGTVCTPGHEAQKADGTRLIFKGQGSAGLGEYGQGDYNASAELWGVNGYNYEQTMGVCTHDAWYLDVKTDNTKNDGAVKAYPSMRKFYWDYSAADGNLPRLSTFPQLTIDYGSNDPATCPGCIYDTAFDIWLNTADFSKSTELMVWTHNVGQFPAGSKIASAVKLDGHTWDVWADAGGYRAFVPTDTTYLQSGTLDAKAFISWLVTNKRIRDDGIAADQADPKVAQPSFGVETVSTGAVTRHWDFTKFTIHDGR